MRDVADVIKVFFFFFLRSNRKFSLLLTTYAYYLSFPGSGGWPHLAGSSAQGPKAAFKVSGRLQGAVVVDGTPFLEAVGPRSLLSCWLLTRGGGGGFGGDEGVPSVSIGHPQFFVMWPFCRPSHTWQFSSSKPEAQSLF